MKVESILFSFLSHFLNFQIFIFFHFNSFPYTSYCLRFYKQFRAQNVFGAFTKLNSESKVLLYNTEQNGSPEASLGDTLSLHL